LKTTLLGVFREGSRGRITGKCSPSSGGTYSPSLLVHLPFDLKLVWSPPSPLRYSLSLRYVTCLPSMPRCCSLFCTSR
jgi:hypothetical protein